MNSIKPYSKAIVAVAGALITALVQAFPDSPDVARWCSFASTILTALAVYLVPNRDPEATHQDESVQPPAASLGDPLDQFGGSARAGIETIARDALNQPTGRGE